MEKKDGALVNLSEKYIKWFSDLSRDDIKVAGLKGTNIAHLYNSKFNVPEGFVIDSQAFDYFVVACGIQERIENIISMLNIADIHDLEEKSAKIRELITSQKMPSDLRQEIIEAYNIISSDKLNTTMSRDAFNILKNAKESVFVAIRPSPGLEDIKESSFAGQQDSYLNVKGEENLIEGIKKCFASFYSERAIYYRILRGIDKKNPVFAIVVQKMINPQKSGIASSKNPVNYSNEIIIEAIYGLGVGFDLGIIPDNYIVSLDLEIKKVNISDKLFGITRDGAGELVKVRLKDEVSKSQVLTNGSIKEIADYALRIEEIYGEPQEIDFAVEDTKVYIIQSKPLVGFHKSFVSEQLDGRVILKGNPSSSGVMSGEVCIINSQDDLENLKKGNVLVTNNILSYMIVSMQKAGAIVTNQGGINSYVASIAREMKIPLVSGTKNATDELKQGERVTVDGTNGFVYDGDTTRNKIEEKQEQLSEMQVLAEETKTNEVQEEIKEENQEEAKEEVMPEEINKEKTQEIKEEDNAPKIEQEKITEQSQEIGDEKGNENTKQESTEHTGLGNYEQEIKNEIENNNNEQGLEESDSESIKEIQNLAEETKINEAQEEAVPEEINEEANKEINEEPKQEIKEDNSEENKEEKVNENTENATLGTYEQEIKNEIENNEYVPQEKSPDELMHEFQEQEQNEYSAVKIDNLKEIEEKSEEIVSLAHKETQEKLEENKKIEAGIEVVEEKLTDF
ncbi:MAG: PEP/pyruvate-binding domain-containing protein [Candidatus Nanoarchaeia archaeon]